MKWIRSILAVLLLGCCTLWVVSYWGIEWGSARWDFGFELRDGSLITGFANESTSFDSYFTIDGFNGLATNWWPIAWVLNADDMLMFLVTFWLPTLLLAFSLTFTFIPCLRRKRRSKQEFCIQCGYDLKGAEHDACPECGAVVGRGSVA